MITFSESLNNPYEIKFEGIERVGDDVAYPGWFDAESGSYYFMAVSSADTKTTRIDFSDEDGENAITGLAGKDSFRVFASIMRLINIMIRTHPTFTIAFEGNKTEMSRVRLYDALAKRVQSTLRGRIERIEGKRNIIWRIHHK